MVKVILEGNRKEVERVKKLLDEYTLVRFLYSDTPIFGNAGDTRQTLKIQTPDEFWDEC